MTRKTTLRERFDKRGFSPAAYAKAYGVRRDLLYEIFNGDVKGKNNTKKGDVRRIIARLKKDGVWIGILPWEK